MFDGTPPNSPKRSVWDKEIRLRDAFWGRTELTFRQAFALLTLQRTHVYFALVLVALFASDAPGLHAHMGLWRAALIWPVSLLTYVTTFMLVFSMIILLQRRKTPVVPTPLVGAVAILPTVAVSEYLAMQLSNTDYTMQIKDNIVLFWVLTQGFETLFIRFVIPLVASDFEAKEEPFKPEPSPPTLKLVEPDNPAPRLLTIAGSQIDITGLLYVEARQHFVRVTLPDRQIEKRARLSDIVAQIEEIDGIQPHRSWWVASDALPRLEQVDGKPVLRLKCGVEVPVARGRLQSVTQWIAQRMAAE